MHEEIPREIPKEIDIAIESGNFELARKLQQEGGFSEQDILLVAAACFEDCLDIGTEESMEKGAKILNEFKIPRENYEERIIFFMSEGLQSLNFFKIFPYFSKYFEVTEEM